MASTVWRGYITFGLISIPVRLFRAARPERVNLKQLYRVQSPQTANQTARQQANDPEQDANDAEEEPEPVAASAPSRTGGVTLRSAGPQPVPYRAGTSAASNSAAPAPEVLAPVRRVAVDESDQSVVPSRALTKGYEYEKDRFVALDPEELKSIVPKTATEMEILEFVKLDDIDPVYFEASYYVRPEGAGEKPYALLYQALQKTRLVAIAKFAMHSREHVVVLRPGKRGLISHTMYFQLGSSRGAGVQGRHRPDRIERSDLAEKLIHSLAAELSSRRNTKIPTARSSRRLSNPRWKASVLRRNLCLPGARRSSI